MKSTLIALAMLSCLASAQTAPSQSQRAAIANPTAKTSSMAAGTSDALNPNNDKDPIQNALKASDPKAAKQDKKKINKDEGARPNDSDENPYWEPRDWTYIYNQGP